MENKKHKTIIIILLLIITGQFIYYNNINNELNEKIQKMQVDNYNLEDDKNHYKNLYIKLAEDYSERLHELGINEYILTDTSR